MLGLMTLYKKTYRVESTRSSRWDYRLPGWYFVTICTERHTCYFGEIVEAEMCLLRAGQIAHSGLLDLSKHYSNVKLDVFIVMPNHIDAIIVLEGAHYYSPDENIKNAGLNGISLGNVVGSYKAGVTRECREAGIPIVWQPRFYDHILRSQSSLAAVRSYIRNNPANWSRDPENTVEAFSIRR